MPNRRRSGPKLPVFELNGRNGVPDVQVCGFKAHNLIRMAALGLPVPSGFVLGTAWCQALHADAAVSVRLDEILQGHVHTLELQTGLEFGGSRRPLLVSVRSGAPVSMPGMLDTVLDVGLNDDSLAGLLRLTGDHRLVWDSYSRLVMAFAEIVAGVAVAPFERVLDSALRRAGVATSRQLDFRALRELTHRFLDLYEDHTGRAFPQDPMEQLRAATAAVFASWNSDRAATYRRLNAIPDTLGTAVTVQCMVFGNSGVNSGAGVGFTRDPSTGEKRAYVDWLARAQGEDIVSGRRRVGMEEHVPAWLLCQLETIGEVLETAFRDAQEYEFTIQNGELFMLQTRTAKRATLAALRIAVDQVDSGLITPEEGLQRLAGIELDSLVIQRVETPEAPIGTAIPAGPGVAAGPAAFSVETAQRFAERGTPPILVRGGIATADIAGIAVVAGILTAAGGRTSHAAVIARQMGKVCLVGCDALRLDETAGRAILGETAIAEGDTICLDGNSGAVYAGAPPVVARRPTGLLERVERWRMRLREG